jgi:SAM-dependent methyltransferase
MLDNLLSNNIHLFRGVVLDIGGRDRGNFKKPKDKVERWIFADIEKKHNPDMIINVENLKGIENDSIDVICAMELFEHVYNTDAGLNECYRVLKPNGTLIMSVPFLHKIHADPFDYQRWTKDKWNILLEAVGFNIAEFHVIGRFFTLQAEMLRKFVKILPYPLKAFLYLLYPFFDLIALVDNTNWSKTHPFLKNYHCGYFVICEKK